MDSADSETQPPDDLLGLEMANNSPPMLAQECRGFKWKVKLIDDDGNIQEQMVTTKDVWKLENRKVIVQFDEDSGQPDEDSGGLLGSWLGQLSDDVNLLPIDYSDWRLVPAYIKDRAWEVIKAKFWFDDPTTRKVFVISALGARCKDLKVRLWRDHKRNDRSETLNNRPKGIPEDQWCHLVDMRFTDKWKRTQNRNTQSQKNNKARHSCGRRSIARTRRGIKNITGKTPSRAELFIETRKKPDGTFISDEARKRADELALLLAQNPQTQVPNTVTTCLGDEFSRVFGPERSGRVRCVGRGPTPSKLIKRSISIRSEAANAEVAEMRRELAAQKNQIQSLKEFIGHMFPNGVGIQASPWAAYASLLSAPNLTDFAGNPGNP